MNPCLIKDAWDGKFLQSLDIFCHLWLESTILVVFSVSDVFQNLSISWYRPTPVCVWMHCFRIEFVWVTPWVFRKKKTIDLRQASLKAESAFLWANYLRILPDDRLNNKWCSEKRQVPEKWNVIDIIYTYSYSFVFVVCWLSDAVWCS